MMLILKPKYNVIYSVTQANTEGLRFRKYLCLVAYGQLVLLLFFILFLFLFVSFLVGIERRSSDLCMVRNCSQKLTFLLSEVLLQIQKQKAGMCIMKYFYKVTNICDNNGFTFCP